MALMMTFSKRAVLKCATELKSDTHCWQFLGFTIIVIMITMMMIIIIAYYFAYDTFALITDYVEHF